jgi:signal transduction histidine kinase
MRWLPRSLFSRMVLVLLTGLVVAQLASLAVYWQDRGEFMQRAMGMRSVQRVADIIRLLETIAPSERERIISVLSSPPLRISTDVPALAMESDPDKEDQARAFSATLRRALGNDTPLAVKVSDAPARQGPGPGYGRMQGMMRGPGMPGTYGPGMMEGFGPHGVSFIVQARLKDGTLVTFDSRQPIERVNWPSRLLLSLAILLVAVIALTLLAVRWVTRPLKTLAAAAAQLGEDINRPPLDERGPVEVARAARAFNTMQQRLATFIRDRTRVFAAMSHDLKTPITRLRLRTELMGDEALRPKFEKDLQEMESMVKATLDFMRGVDSHEEPKPLDVMALLHSVQEDARELNGKVRIEGTTNVPYRGRIQALKRCLNNLVENAVNYGQSATITVEDAPGVLTLRIRDEGPGIPESELERVFEPFHRLEGSRNRATGGTGLGLSIARNIARSHGGELTLHNLPHGGLEARLTLPRR